MLSDVKGTLAMTHLKSHISVLSELHLCHQKGQSIFCCGSSNTIIFLIDQNMVLTRGVKNNQPPSIQLSPQNHLLVRSEAVAGTELFVHMLNLQTLPSPVSVFRVWGRVRHVGNNQIRSNKYISWLSRQYACDSCKWM